MAKARDNVQTIKGVKRYKQSQLLAVGNPTDLAIEAVRSLRTSLHFAMMQARNNVLMLTGVSPSVGKHLSALTRRRLLARLTNACY